MKIISNVHQYSALYLQSCRINIASKCIHYTCSSLPVATLNNSIHKILETFFAYCYSSATKVWSSCSLTSCCFFLVLSFSLWEMIIRPSTRGISRVPSWCAIWWWDMTAWLSWLSSSQCLTKERINFAIQHKFCNKFAICRKLEIWPKSQVNATL